MAAGNNINDLLRPNVLNVVTLHDHLLKLIEEMDRRIGQRFEDHEKAVGTALTAQEKQVGAALVSADRAVTKAEQATEKRFENVNEFRAALNDMMAKAITRQEYEQSIKTIADKVDSAGKVISDRMNTYHATTDTRINRLEAALAASAGAEAKSQSFTATTLTVIGLVVAVVAAALGATVAGMVEYVLHK